MNQNKKLLFSLLFLIFDFSIQARSIYRPEDPFIPEIIVRWKGDSKSFRLKKYHLEEYPLQLFDKENFEKHKLPQTISYRYNPAQNVETHFLSSLIEQLIDEIKQGKKTFSNFKILQAKDYNFTTGKGLLIVKFNDYPFVAKLFIETPDSFITPFDKGIAPIFFFFMGGGINRHMSGFTRIKNRDIILERLSHSPWAGQIEIPRKWTWLPKQCQWIEVQGKNIGGHKNLTVEFPGTYCIIADAIENERELSLFNPDDKKTALNICNYLNLWIDPHMKNFMIEKGTHKLIIVDTEHFPSFVGLREKISFDSYSNWYMYLAGKCFQSVFMQTKKVRRIPQKPQHEMNLIDQRIVVSEAKNETLC